MTTRAGWTILSLLGLMVGWTMVWHPPGLYADPAWGILAAEQHSLGQTPDLFHLCEADATHLEYDTFINLSWWAPSYQTVPYLFKQAGLNWGNSVRRTVFLAWILGMVGWAYYFRIVLPSQDALPWFLILFLLYRFSHSNVWLYDGGECLLWGAFPLVFLVQVHAVSTCVRWKGSILSFIAGLLSAGLFVVKYSAALVIVGMLVAWVICLVLRKVDFLRLGCFVAGLLWMGGFFYRAGYPGGSTPAGAAVGYYWSWGHVWPWGAIALAMTDLESLMKRIFYFPPHPVFHDLSFLVGLGWVCFLGMMVFIFRRNFVVEVKKRFDSKRAFAFVWVSVLTVIAVAPGILMVLLIRGAAVDVEARHLRIPGLMMLPFAFWGVVFALRRGSSKIKRGLIAAVFAMVFILPAGYGLSSLLKNTWLRRAQANLLVSPQGIRLDLLGEQGNAVAFYSELKKHLLPGTICYLTSPDLAISLAPQRLLVRPADFQALEVLQSARYFGNLPEGVGLVLPHTFERNGKRVAIQNSFVDIQSWQEIPLASAPQGRLWLSRGGER
jgi:hypothetical protein